MDVQLSQVQAAFGQFCSVLKVQWFCGVIDA